MQLVGHSWYASTVAPLFFARLNPRAVHFRFPKFSDKPPNAIINQEKVSGPRTNITTKKHMQEKDKSLLDSQRANFPIALLHPDGGGKVELDGRAGHGGPHDDGLGADLVPGGTAGGGGRVAGERNGDGSAAAVAVGGYGDAGD